MLQYRVIVKNKDESEQWELPCKSLTLDWRLNSVHTGSIYVDYVYLTDALQAQGITGKSLFESGFLSVYIYADEILLFAGYISGVRYQKYTNAFNVEISVKSWLGFFENLYYTGNFSATNSGQIAWNVIDSANEIGITQGTISTTKPRDRRYKYDSIAKIVMQLTRDAILEGFDLSIDNNKVFSVFESIGNSYDSLIINESNVYDWTVSVPLVGSIFTDGIILGGGFGEDQKARTYAAGSQYIDKWFKSQALIQDINTDSDTNLDDKIEGFVELRKAPIRNLTVKLLTDQGISPVSFDVGDSLMIKLPDAEIDELRRVRKKSLYIGDQSYISLEFDHE